MRNETEDSVDLWRQVASAVEYIAAVERPGFSVSDAIEEALSDWLQLEPATTYPTSNVEADGFRLVLHELLRQLPPVGVPCGVSIAQGLEAAVADWLSKAALQHNTGLRFG